MIKNERGSTLLIVMLMMLVFTILGLAIMSASIGGAKRTEYRKDEVVGNLDAINAVNDGIASIRVFVKKTYNADTRINDYSNAWKTYLDDAKQKFDLKQIDYTIEDISTKDYKIAIDSDFTRVLIVSAQYAPGRSYHQKVYVTPMPSFLKYAIGSRSNLIINGSGYFDGNLYARTGIDISNEAKYIYENDNRLITTEYPSIKDLDKNRFIVENINSIEMSACKNPDTQGKSLTLGHCYDPTLPLDAANFTKKVGNHWSEVNLKVEDKKNLPFSPNAPKVISDKTQFVDVDIDKSFRQKLEEIGYSHDQVANGDIKNIISQYSNVYGLEAIKTFEGLNPNAKNYLYNGNALVDSNTIDVKKDSNQKWIIINGDAVFESEAGKTMNVAANVLITGNLIIRGDIAFDSTIYVLGNTTINNVNLTGLNNSELILMTKGNLEIARINKFSDSTSENNKIKAYLYTDSAATVYAIGSFLNIEGGLFAHGNLEVNAFRGNTSKGSTDLSFEATPNDEKASRLKITNSKELFLHQGQGLPKVEKLEVITDLINKD